MRPAGCAPQRRADAESVRRAQLALQRRTGAGHTTRAGPQAMRVGHGHAIMRAHRHGIGITQTSFYRRARRPHEHLKKGSCQRIVERSRRRALARTTSAASAASARAPPGETRARRDLVACDRGWALSGHAALAETDHQMLVLHLLHARS
ncbi:unnamed protein product [Prorocentrum cordatum]|uniref:Uncharacterized protein n=1 Tax=Prorocentrum cordatum TaxID=2364126 RepID=A0ABN9Y6F6_9DINO|nr:unnamed protein product [Polarella glacialis]